MTRSISGTGIRNLVTATVTEAGDHMILTLQPRDGEAMALALPSEQLHTLLLMTAQSASASKRKKGGDPNNKTAFPVESWEIGTDAASGAAIFTMVFGRGAELSFQLPVQAIRQMRDALSAALEQVPSDPAKLH